MIDTYSLDQKYTNLIDRFAVGEEMHSEAVKMLVTTLIHEVKGIEQPIEDGLDEMARKLKVPTAPTDHYVRLIGYVMKLMEMDKDRIKELEAQVQAMAGTIAVIGERDDEPGA